MANLGKLWFELGLKDRTDKDIEEIRKKVEKRLKELGVDVKITPDLSELKKVNVEIKTDTSQMISDIKAKLESADIEITPKVSIDNAMRSIAGPRAITVDTGAFARIDALLDQQRKAAGGAADALSSYQRTFESFSKKSATATGSIKAMEAELNKLRDTYRSLSEADRNSAIGRGLLQQINNADEALAKVNAEMANNAALAKAMGTRYNGLQVQLAQVAREMPNFAMSFSTGIISLSNNLPMLADEIARVRQEVELAKKSGQTVAPVWKQVLGALLNWQTALIVGITVLVAYSDEIAKWVEALIKGGDAAVYLAESQKKFNDLQRQASEDAAKEIAKLELLYNTTQDAAVSIDARREAVEKLQQLYPDYLGKLSEEAILAGKASEAYNLLTESIKNSASLRLIEEQRAKASKALVEAKEKEMDVQSKINALMKENNADNEEELVKNAFAFSRNYGNYIKNLISSRNAAKRQQQEILDDTGKWQKQYNSLFNRSNNSGQLDVLFRDMPEYSTYGKTLEDLERSLSLSEITQEEYNKKVNEAKGVLLAAADAAKIGGSEVEKLRGEYIAFNKVQNANKTIGVGFGKLIDDALKSSQQLNQAITKAELELERSRVSLMAEGGEKELAQLRLNHQKRMAEIDKQTQDIINKAREAEKSEWRQKNPTAKEGSFTSRITSVEDLPTQFQQTIQELVNTENELYSKSIQDYFSSVAKEFQGYLDRRKAIEEEFARKRADLFKSGASTETIQESDYQEQQALQQLDMEIAQRERTFQSWVSSIADMGLEQLRRMLIEAQAELTRLEIAEPANATELAKYRAMLIEIRKEIDKIQGGKGKDKTDSGAKEWDDLYKVLTKVNDAFIEIGDTVGGTVGEIIKQAGSLTTSFLQMVNAIQGIGKAVSSLEKASVILTAISAGMQLVTGIFSIFNRKDYMKEFRKEANQLNEELRNLKANARIDSGAYDTIFGDDVWKNAINNIYAANEALADYNKTLDDIQNRKYYSSFDSENGLWGDRDMDRDYIKDMKKDFEDAADSIANMQLQIRHSTWFRKAKYTSLKDAVPELFNEDDSVNMDALEEFINSDMFSKLSQQDKEYLQEMSNNWKLYQDAIASVNDYLTDVFGNLGNTMMDALVDAFENGTDAAQAFTDSVSDMLERLASNMIYSVTLGPLFEQAQKDMLAIMGDETKTDEEKFDGYTAVLDGLINDALIQQGVATNLMEKYKEMAAEKGLDIYTPNDNVSSSGGSAIQASEETMQLTNSYLNAIRQDVSVKRNLLESIGNNLLPTISITAQAQLQQLNAIAANTKANADAAKRIDDALSSVITTGNRGKAIKIL